MGKARRGHRHRRHHRPRSGRARRRGLIELPEEGASFGAGDSFGTIESVKAVSDLYTPVGGEVVGVNETLNDSPERVNEDPYGGGWIIRLRVSGEGELLSADEYEKLLEEEEI